MPAVRSCLVRLLKSAWPVLLRAPTRTCSGGNYEDMHLDWYEAYHDINSRTHLMYLLMHVGSIQDRLPSRFPPLIEQALSRTPLGFGRLSTLATCMGLAGLRHSWKLFPSFNEFHIWHRM